MPRPADPLCRWADNGDDVNNVVVIVENVSAGSIDSLGSPDKFLQDRAYLFGESAAFTGARGAGRPWPRAAAVH